MRNVLLCSFLFLISCGEAPKSQLSFQGASLACVDGYQVYCVRRPDGTYNFDPGKEVRRLANECPVFEKPDNAVDDSFCQ